MDDLEKMQESLDRLQQKLKHLDLDEKSRALFQYMLDSLSEMRTALLDLAGLLHEDA